MTGLYVLYGVCAAMCTALIVAGSVVLGYGWLTGAGVSVALFAVSGALGWAWDVAYEARHR